MVPIALTCKSNNELMIVHMCVGCNAFSKNRIAGDDSEYAIMKVYENSLELEIHIKTRLTNQGIYILNICDEYIVRTGLWGK